MKLKYKRGFSSYNYKIFQRIEEKLACEKAIERRQWIIQKRELSKY